MCLRVASAGVPQRYAPEDWQSYHDIHVSAERPIAVRLDYAFDRRTRVGLLGCHFAAVDVVGFEARRRRGLMQSRRKICVTCSDMMGLLFRNNSDNASDCL